MFIKKFYFFNFQFHVKLKINEKINVLVRL